MANNSDELDKATLKLELANLMVELANAKIEAVTMQTLLFDAEQKIKMLEDDLKYKSAFTFKDGLYWKEGVQVAFCPQCFEVKKLKTYMRYIGAAGRSFEAYRICSNCRFSS